jgi:Xaa-Pro aminopeptidase
MDGWLIYDYRQSNSFFHQALGPLAMVTRPAFLFVPAKGEAVLLVHHVDLGRFSHVGHRKIEYTSHTSLLGHLGQLLKAGERIAMEYSPMGALPRASRVDGGTLEMVRSVGVEVVSSADLVQYATQRWSPAQLRAHRRAADKLSQIVMEAFQYMGQHLGDRPSELEMVGFIQGRFREEALETPDGPIVAVDHHSSDPHYLPTGETALPIKAGSWVLIDMWAREAGADGIFADITWVGYVGGDVPRQYQEVFDVVVGARDAALSFLEDNCQNGEFPQGWEVDQVAREYVSSRGYGEFFTHRLGHSLGIEVHGEAVNLDGWETHDTRLVIPHIGVTIEPGIYLPQFGMRSEIDVYMAESGPEVTTAVQREVALIG